MKVKRSFIPRLSVLFLVFAIMAVASCGNSDNGSPVGGGGTPAGPQGKFLDSAVEGLTFVASGDTGETDTQGTFRYKTGSNVKFLIGDITVGEGTPAAMMTPMDLVPLAASETDDTVTNMARFLQTLDDDGDVNNGITITGAVRIAAAGQTIDFSQTTGAFSADANVQTVVSNLTAQTTAGTRPLVSIQSAQDHLRAALISTYDGTYRGTYSLDQDPSTPVGTWQITVTAANVICNFTHTTGPPASSFNLTGTMNLPGVLDLAAIGGAFIYGNIARGGSVTGRWYGPPPLNDSGNFTGQKQ